MQNERILHGDSITLSVVRPEGAQYIGVDHQLLVQVDTITHAASFCLEKLGNNTLTPSPSFGDTLRTGDFVRLIVGLPGGRYVRIDENGALRADAASTDAASAFHLLKWIGGGVRYNYGIMRSGEPLMLQEPGPGGRFLAVARDGHISMVPQQEVEFPTVAELICSAAQPGVSGMG